MTTNEPATWNDVERIAEAVKAKTKSGGMLCNCMDTCEAETMIEQTFLGALNRGKPWNIRGEGVFKRSNAEAYGELLLRGLFIEEARGVDVLVRPTKALIAHMESYFKTKNVPVRD